MVSSVCALRGAGSVCPGPAGAEESCEVTGEKGVLGVGFCLGNGLMGHSCFAVVRALPMAAPAPARKVSDETCHPSAMLEMSPSLSGDTRSWFSAGSLPLGTLPHPFLVPDFWDAVAGVGTMLDPSCKSFPFCNQNPPLNIESITRIWSSAASRAARIPTGF